MKAPQVRSRPLEVLAFSAALAVALALFVSQIQLAWALLTHAAYLEPAENENMVLVSAYLKSWTLSLNGLVEHGVLPIYPDLFHRVSARLPFELFKTGRLVSLAATLVLLLSVGRMAWRSTRAWPLTLLLPFMALGAERHGLYLLMFRTDALCLCLGYLSLLLLLEETTPTSGSRPRWRYLVSGLLLALSLMTKQTALFFGMVIGLLLGLRFLFHGSATELKRGTLLTGAGFLVAAGAYILLVSPDALLAARIGVKLYGAYDLSVLHLHTQSFLADGYAVALGIASVTIALSWRQRDRYRAAQSAVLLLSCILYSLRLWGNRGSLSNNFFLLSISSALVIAWNAKAFGPWGQKGLASAVACLLLIFFHSLGDLAKFQSPAWVASLNLRQHDLPHSAIFAEMVRAPGEVLTDRLDLYPLELGKAVTYESSAVSPIFLDDPTVESVRDFPEIQRRLRALLTQIRGNIARADYSAILIGINGPRFLKIFPGILTHYRLVRSEETTQGSFRFDLSLYRPRGSAEMGAR